MLDILMLRFAEAVYTPLGQFAFFGMAVPTAFAMFVSLFLRSIADLALYLRGR